MRNKKIKKKIGSERRKIRVKKDQRIVGEKCVSGLVILVRGNLLESLMNPFLSKHRQGKLEDVLDNSLCKPPQ